MACICIYVFLISYLIFYLFYNDAFFCQFYEYDCFQTFVDLMFLC